MHMGTPGSIRFVGCRRYESEFATSHEPHRIATQRKPGQFFTFANRLTARIVRKIINTLLSSRAERRCELSDFEG